jgi:iodothyronine deiodinase-like protein
MYGQYKDRAAFYVVYIMEAHPIDAWTDDDNEKAKIVVASAKSEAERCATAETCVTKLSMQIPPVIDDLNNSTEIAYTGWPDRLYVIDAEGRVAYKSKPGPYGFKPDEVETALKRLVPSSSQQVTETH